MNDIIAFVGPGFSQKESQRIAELLCMHSIETTETVHLATLVIVPGTPKNSDKTLQPQQLSIELVPSIMDIVIPKPMQKSNKKTFANNKSIHQFNTTKRQTCKQIFNRTQCK